MYPPYPFKNGYHDALGRPVDPGPSPEQLLREATEIVLPLVRHELRRGQPRAEAPSRRDPEAETLRLLVEAGVPLRAGVELPEPRPEWDVDQLTPLAASALMDEAGIPIVERPPATVVDQLREAQQERVHELAEMSEALGVPLRYSPDLVDTRAAARALGYGAPEPATAHQLMREAGVPLRLREADADERPAHVVVADLHEVVPADHPDRARIAELRQKGAALDKADHVDIAALAQDHGEGLADLYARRGDEA